MAVGGHPILARQTFKHLNICESLLKTSTVDEDALPADRCRTKFKNAMDFDLSQDNLKDTPSSSSQLLHDLPSKKLISGTDSTDHSYKQQSASSHHGKDSGDTILLTTPLSTPEKIEHLTSRNTSTQSYQTGSAICKIEEICEAMTDCMIGRRRQFSIHLKSRSLGAKDATPGSKEIFTSRVVQFPSSSPREAWKFVALLRILELSHEALVTGNIITKRDMYYRDPELFTKQAIVDRFVDDIACTLGLKRDALNVMAAAKGLVTGWFIMKRRNQSIMDYSSAADSQLVPWVKEIEEMDLSEVKWILVIEKEATFRTLAGKRYWEYSTAGRGILLTAKGYPDIQSRQFLHYLAKHHPTISIYALVDFDPDGIGIMSTYKHGSVALAHENENLSVPSMLWLGLKSKDMMQGGKENEGLLKLTERDRRLAVKMLQRNVCQEDGDEDEWRKEIQVMLMLNKKAEIQIIGAGDALENWLNRNLGKEKNRLELL
ncbi:putative meiosis-specific topoisomerase spo11 protein [Botrytis fragariae]|uniref:DNA topoisomerase (ATP-hydrolyzing) n=1 Tax=Botrytis fragariae TaxID=1964551 RepID=A0A8H6AYB4_9HELO|nr:putative meiosis-specific topoisomerase spo11 protein [Botrytis fragariae]KAF5875863.1 putative meiosis-specific topoisomerase spo11 protein [Botrytis fragariae]